jgi:hypothetical protein
MKEKSVLIEEVSPNIFQLLVLSIYLFCGACNADSFFCFCGRTFLLLHILIPGFHPGLLTSGTYGAKEPKNLLKQNKFI